MAPSFGHVNQEFEEIKTHPFVARRILESLACFKDIVPIVYYHHERVDGTGYPEGKKGDEIPLGARILAVADAYDAMTSDRAYRKRLSHRDAIAYLKKNAGTKFDRRIVRVFIQQIGCVQNLSHFPFLDLSIRS